MNEKQSQQLKVNDRVIWDGYDSDCGTVVEIEIAGVKIQWDNGRLGTLDYRDLEKVGLLSP